MGTHGDGKAGRSGRGHGKRPATGRRPRLAGSRLPGSSGLSGSRLLALRDWSVSSRLLAVTVLALAMGLVFGGLRVATAVGGASQFGRVSQLAQLGEQLTVLTQDLQNERDQTSVAAAGGGDAALRPLYAASDAEAARVRRLAAGIGGGFPANIQAEAAAVASDATYLSSVRTLARGDGPPTNVITNYATAISDMIELDNQIAQGVSDSALADEVRTLTALSQAKDQASQQRALLYSSLSQRFFNVGSQPALSTAIALEQLEETSFQATATPREISAVSTILAAPQVGNASVVEQFMLSDSSPFGDLSNVGLGTRPGAQWYQLMSFKLDKMQGVELGIARDIAARAQALQGTAQRSALLTGILTLALLLLVLAATLAVGRSLVRPLERLRAAALDIAMTELPDRVRRIGEASLPGQPAPADRPGTPELAGDDIAPIEVTSADEIGQVARAFDQVHREAVRLASNEAMLRSNFNAMFVNLSRRSQVLIERLARMIDSLEQAEEDPGRLSSLFSMDHLVTRMRRNSENLLLLAGHEGARKWSEPAPLSDVARAATSEIEQYARISLAGVPGVSVEGQAVSDIVHLLAELIENATMFSPKETQVHVSARELSGGGVLVEIADRGVGISPSRLTELNWRLDNPPVIDVSVTRHMGLFAVGRLAQRHGVRVRLRSGTSQGLTALVWLPDAIVDRNAPGAGSWWESPARSAGAAASAGSVSAGTIRAGTIQEGLARARPLAAPVEPEPVSSGRTAAGLPVRAPGASYVADQQPQSQQRQPQQQRSPLSPDRARSKLSGFQRGARRARGEGAGR